MDKKPEISVVMPVYNAAPYLALAIESILKQSFSDFEFIIVEDGSSDASREIVAEFAKKDSRIHLIINEKNIGETPSRNVGLGASSGKYIAVFDADDVSFPKRLQLQKEFLDTHPEIFLVGARPEIIDEEGNVVRQAKVMTDPAKLSAAMPQANYFYHPSVMYRNEMNLRYREKIPYAGDYDFYMNILSRGKRLANLPETLIQYRMNRASLSETKTVKQILMAEKVKEMYRMRIETGSDNYDSFDPQEILSIDDEKVIKNRTYLQALINNAVKRRNVEKIRLYAWKYLTQFGFKSSNMRLLVLSLIPPLFRAVMRSK